VACETKFIQFVQVGLMIMSSTRMWTPFEMSIISTFQHKIQKDGDRRTCVYSRETWNPTFLIMEWKASQIISRVATQIPSWVAICSLHWHIIKHVSPLNLLFNHKCTRPTMNYQIGEAQPNSQHRKEYVWCHTKWWHKYQR